MCAQFYFSTLSNDLINDHSLYIQTPAALVCCRTDDELNEVLVPEVSRKFTACADNIFVSRIQNFSILYQ